MAEYEGRKKHLMQFNDYEEESCFNCEHFSAHDDHELEGSIGHGLCLRFPPPNKEGNPPEMMIWQGCGEWSVNKNVNSRAMSNSIRYWMPDDVWEPIEKKKDEFLSKLEGYSKDYFHFASRFIKDDEFQSLFSSEEKSWVVHALLGMSYELCGDEAQKVVQETKAYRESHYDEFRGDF